MIYIVTTKRFIFSTSSRLITYQVRVSSAQTCWADCFMSVDHDFVIGSFGYGIEIMIYHPLAVVVFAARDDITHISTLYSIVAVVCHELVSFIHMTFIISYR